MRLTPDLEFFCKKVNWMSLRDVEFIYVQPEAVQVPAT